MKLTFRQGIVRHQSDVSGNPTFLQRSAANGQFVDLVVSPTPTILAFAHREGTYLVEELKTVPNAWGPLSSATSYLYWDVNLLNASLTRGITLLPPIYSPIAPNNPAADQHWFNTAENLMRVWNGSKWVEKIRVFAGFVSSGSIVQSYPIGSQAEINGDFEAGNIVLDSFGMPLRQSNGCFVTTTTWLNVVNLGTVTARLDGAIMNGMAAEELPKFSLVQLRSGRRLVLARSTDYNTRISGLVCEDLYEGEIGRVVSSGVVRSDSWSFNDNVISKPLFCGPTGEVTTVAPRSGVIQQIGFVYDKDAIFMDIKQPIILEDPGEVAVPGPVIPTVPTAKFSVDTTSGIAPLQVKFTNLSVNGHQFEWDFTNDGYVDTTVANPTFTYTTPGEYTVRLRAMNNNGVSEEIKAKLIKVVSTAVSKKVNLGISFGAPTTVMAATPFNFQVLTTNDGADDATSVARELIIRAADGSDVIILDPAPEVKIEKIGSLTKVYLPKVDISSGNYAAFTLSAKVASGASAIVLQGSVTSAETDSEILDNTAALNIGVRG